MIVIAAVVLGAVWGNRRAVRAGGNVKDRLQYAAVHAVALSLPALFLTILLDRLLRG